MLDADKFSIPCRGFAILVVLSILYLFFILNDKLLEYMKVYQKLIDHIMQ